MSRLVWHQYLWRQWCMNHRRPEDTRRNPAVGVVVREPSCPSWLMLSTGVACAINDCNAIIDCMASITIRNLEEATKRKLKIRAAIHGRSMEQEAREILKNALRQKPRTGADLVKAIRQRFAPLGGVELEPFPREPIRDPDWLKDWK